MCMCDHVDMHLSACLCVLGVLLNMAAGKLVFVSKTDYNYKWAVFG